MRMVNANSVSVQMVNGKMEELRERGRIKRGKVLKEEGQRGLG